MKVLVTGGAGFIGSHIVEHFQGRAEVRVLDNLSSQRAGSAQPFTPPLVRPLTSCRCAT